MGRVWIVSPASCPMCRWLSLAVLVVGGVASPTKGQNTTQDRDGSRFQLSSETTVESLFVNFLHYARMGRFTMADEYARALLARPDLDPVAILEIASRDRKSLETLLRLISHSTIGPSASQVLELIERGEYEKRKNPERISRNIENLGGNPQQAFFAIQRLAQSGEYTIPHMLRMLSDPARLDLQSRIITALPRIGKPAVHPLVVALAVKDEAIRQALIESLGEIGYAHAIPYLRKLLDHGRATEETKTAAAAAIARIESRRGGSISGTAAEAFLQLAQRYYTEEAAIRADPRLPEANVWYWDEARQSPKRVVVPRRIFGPVMAMRCCEEALLLRNNDAEAIALWLAANIRREARLGMNIESGDPTESGEADETRPDVFPRALYFTQAAGPRYAHRVLARAVADNDSAVALGAIEALRVTAGESSLVGAEDYKQPLVQALQFPDLLVRVRAALALGAALPKSSFSGSPLVVPVLAGTLGQTGRRQVLVIDADQTTLNRVMNALRSGDREVIGRTSFYDALGRARVEFQSLGAIFISSDIAAPGLVEAVAELRSEFQYAKTPVVVLTRSGQSVMAEQLAKADPFVERVDSAADDASLEAALVRVQTRTGRAAITPELALTLALQAGQTLRRIAQDGRTVYDLGIAEPALIGALTSEEERLQTLAASVLALLETPTAQRAIAHVALDATNTDSLRIAAFGSLAESAKAHGHRLEESQVTDLISLARDEPDLTIRTAASQSLGALNLATNKASEIIRSYYGG